MLFRIVLLIIALSYSLATQAACNLGEDAAKLTSLNFGRLKLSMFAEGTFRIRNQEALSDGDRWNFTLDPRPSSLRLEVGSSSSPIGSATALSGRLTLAQPLRGSVTERLTANGCQRILQLDDDALSNASLDVASGSILSNFGARVNLTGKRLVVKDSESVSDRRGLTTGTLVFSGRQIRFENARVALPVRGGFITTADFKSGPNNELLFAIALDAMSLRVVQGSIESLPLVVSRRRGLAFSFAGIEAIATRIEAAAVQVTFTDNHIRFMYKGLRLEALEAVHNTPLVARAEGISEFTIRSLSGGAAGVSNGALAPSAQSLSGSGIAISASSIQVARTGGGRLLNGRGKVSIEQISNRNLDATILWDAPDVVQGPTRSFSYKLGKTLLRTSGSKDTAQVSGTTELSNLQLGTFSITGKVPLQYSVLSSMKIDVAGERGAGVVTIGAQGGDQLEGSTSDFRLSGLLENFGGSNEPRFEALPSAVSATINLSAKTIPFLGGNITLSTPALTIQNKQQLALGPASSGTTLDLGKPPLVVSGLRLRPKRTDQGLPIQTAPQRVAAESAAYDIDPAAETPLQLSSTFELPGFELKPPPPLKSLTFEIGNLDVEVTSFKVAKFLFVILPKEIKISAVGIAAGLGRFSSQPAEPGRLDLQPNIRGEASTPLTIEELSGLFRLQPLPPAFAAFDVSKMRFQARHLSYSSNEGLSAHSDLASVNFDEFHASQGTDDEARVQATLALQGSRVAWHGAPNGEATVETFTVKLEGLAAKPSGSVAVRASQISLNGTANVELGTKPDGNSGCSLVVPANASLKLMNISGDLSLLDGKLLGVLHASNADVGRISYYGHQDCRWNQVVKLARVRIEYPCFGTVTDPVRTCEEIIEPRFDVGMVFAVKSVDLFIKPFSADFQVSGGKLGLCELKIDKIYQAVPPLFSIAPQVSIGGDVAKIINDIISLGVGAVESALTSGLLTLYSQMLFVGFGHANPVVSNCDNFPS